MTFSEQWKKAGEDADDFEPPAGTYQTVIVDGGAFTSRAGDDYAKVVLQILAGEYVGRRFQHFGGFKHEVGARIHREALALYGVDGAKVDTIEDLDDAIQELVKAKVQAEVVVSYKDGYMQVRVTGSRSPDRDIPIDGFKVAEQPQTQAPASDFAAASSTPANDDIPFLWRHTDADPWWMA